MLGSSAFFGLLGVNLKFPTSFCTLTYYIGQVTLCDVRFITDSISERLAHACHFGVMVGLAVVGPQFNELDHTTPWTLMRKLSIVLIVSRTVLTF